LESLKVEGLVSLMVEEGLESLKEEALGYG
jgi:hypothetical protein